MITIAIKNKANQVVIGKKNHGTDALPFFAKGEELAVLAIKDYTYQAGDTIVVSVEKADTYFVVQLDETLAPTCIYIPQEQWVYTIPYHPASKTATVDTAFSSSGHSLMVRKATESEKRAYQNVALNTHDQKQDTGAYPHATANVETRDEAVFFAKNAIDGKYGNTSHGNYPFTSWGINQQADAALTIDFGRRIQTDWIRLLFRADYPHDSYWTQVTLVFSDGEERTVTTMKTAEFQEVRFPLKKTTSITLKQLEKAADDSPFPALTQLEVFGNNCFE